MSVHYSLDISMDARTEYQVSWSSFLHDRLPIRFCALQVGPIGHGGIRLTTSTETLRNIVREGQRLLDEIDAGAEVQP